MKLCAIVTWLSLSGSIPSVLRAPTAGVSTTVPHTVRPRPCVMSTWYMGELASSTS
jgi:hypothetical protein